MEGGCWKLRDKKVTAPRADFFLHLRVLGVFFLFFLLLRFVSAWAAADFGAREKPGDSLEGIVLSPFDVQQLCLLPGLGPQKAEELRVWARNQWIHTRGGGGKGRFRPRGIGRAHWKVLLQWLDLSSLKGGSASFPK